MNIIADAEKDQMMTEFWVRNSCLKIFAFIIPPYS